MRPVEVIRSALEREGKTTRGPDHKFMAQCPAHEDGTPSLGVEEASDGKALVKCHAECSTAEVLAAIGLSERDLFPDNRPPGRDDDWQPEREYVYTNADGHSLFKVVRFPGKRFRQKRWTGVEWEWGMDGVTRQLYRLPEVLASKERGDWIFLTEGEKDAEAIVDAGSCATTMPGGAGKWEDQYTETLTGANVVIVADDDEPGKRHATFVYSKLYGKAARVGIRLPAAGHKDIADHLAAGLSLNGALRKTDLLADPAPVGRTATVSSARVFAARPRILDLQVLGPFFQRGMRTVVGAQTGEGKTSFAIDAISVLVGASPRPYFLHEAWRPQRQSCRALIVDLEQGEETLKRRLRERGLDQSERVDVLWEPNGIAIDARDEDRAMVHDVLTEGHYDIVLLDPLYQLHLGSGNDEQVAAETMRIIDGWAREFNASFVVPMHARKPHPQAGSRFTKNEIAGVGTWLRNAEFILGLQMMSTGNSRLWFFKDREGGDADHPEVGKHWWLKFTRESGFERTYKEDHDRVVATLRDMLNRDEGATRAELVRAGGDADEASAGPLSLRRLLRNTHLQGDRYRSRPWAEQTSMLDDAVT